MACVCIPVSFQEEEPANEEGQVAGGHKNKRYLVETSLSPSRHAPPKRHKVAEAAAAVERTTPDPRRTRRRRTRRR